MVEKHYKKIDLKKTANAHIVARKSRIHSTGVFVKEDIRKGSRVIEYVGNKLTKSEADKRADVSFNKAQKNKLNGAVYLFELNKRYDIDGNVSFNTARLINHSCEPNCETEIIRGHIWIIAMRDIKKGEEITYNYGYSIDDFKDHECQCGSPKCPGYILQEDQWPKLRRILKDKTKRKVNSKRYFSL